MAIEINKFKIEEEKLDKTFAWIDEEINIIEENDVQLSNKIAELKREAKGRYNEELETKQKLYTITHKNLLKYQESKEKPYFARIDFREKRRDEESFYIGKFGLGDSHTGEEKVIDWRAPIADLYYSGTSGEAYYEAPVGIIQGELNLKRKFIIKDKKLLEAYDEGINEIILSNGSNDGNGGELIDEFLKYNLEESMGGKLKDVVATIQKEQNAIIRAEKNSLILIQGSAGSGKTTIALHRLAYLLYKYRRKMKGDEVLVIAPNKLFLDYISDILPNLGVEKVKQLTYEELFSNIYGTGFKIISKDLKLSKIIEESENGTTKFIEEVSGLKGSIEFKQIIDKYLEFVEARDGDVEAIKVESYELFRKSEVTRLYFNDFVNLPLIKRKEEIKRYFRLKLTEKIRIILCKIDSSFQYQITVIKELEEDSLDRRKKLIDIYEQRDVRKKELEKKCKKAFEEYFKIWENDNVLDLYIGLLTSKDLFYELSKGTISKELISYTAKEISDNIKNKRLDSDDIAAILYIKQRIEGFQDKWKFQHIVIDEAQDYSEFQLLLLKYLAINNSITIVGDIGQCIYYYKGIHSWENLMEKVLGTKTIYSPLTLSYRSTVEIIKFANKVLEKQNNSLKPAIPVLRHGEAPEIIEFKEIEKFIFKVDDILDKVKVANKKTTAIICKTYKECKSLKESMKKHSRYSWETVKESNKSITGENIIIPSYMTKGLEFDCSIISNCNNAEYKDDENDKRILYVALTRALHFEYVFYKGEISSLLSD